MLWLLALFLCAAVILGGINLWLGKMQHRTLAERACDAANARTRPDLRATAGQGLALADRVLKRDAPTVLPCSEEP